ncbi:MAG: bifunctional glutamate N-acetyltransferase/amino-acid acetyltransferase ArgJ [Planctomycetes bacterium]|nr:bifunctional glutamate N-acetyltransferase/amino-acid acetyltransferase ArgJ [Planctomycetota bacterium]
MEDRLPSLNRVSDARPVLPAGFRASAVHCGIRVRKSKLDLGLIVADRAYPAAALFTSNQLLGAHVVVGRESLAKSGGKVRALLVNSGNANCSTGEEGIEDNRVVQRALAELVGCAPEEVLFMSTGVIGARLPGERILEALPGLVNLANERGLGDFATAIMTTDLVPKVRTLAVEDKAGPPFRVTGVAKGSGMIHPNMATMLAYVLTDGPADDHPREMLKRIADRSFHRLTVDGDTSPNDTFLLWSSQHAEAATHPKSRASWSDSHDDVLEHAVLEVSQELCRCIAADGEGATRLVTVQVHGAPGEREAAEVARTIATSPLTKTAVHGRDPNWGRILAAAGRSGIRFDPNQARVWIGEADVFSSGRPHPENEPAAHLHLLNNHEVVLGIDLGVGSARAEAWTCDFSADYVRINADYRS